MQGPVSRKIQSAADFVLAGMTSGRFEPGRVLPSIRSLALEADTSYVTMWRALDWLRQEQRLIGQAGRMLRVAGEHRAHTLPGPKNGTANCGTDSVDDGQWIEMLAARIRKDIFSGRYQPGSPLPLFKQLCHHYRTTTRSLRKALLALCNEGVVVVIGRGFAVPGFSAQTPRDCIVLLVPQEYFEHYLLDMSPSHDYIRNCEFYASRAGIRLIVEPYPWIGDSNPEVQARAGISAESRSNEVLGYIYVPGDPKGNDPFLKQMKQLKKPIVIIEQQGDWVLPQWLKDHPVKIIPLGINTAPGKNVGRFLRGLGHTQICYISQYHTSTWSLNRYKGLAAAFEQADAPNVIIPSDIDGTSWNPPAWDSNGNFIFDPRIKLEFQNLEGTPELANEMRQLRIHLYETLSPMVALRPALKAALERPLQDRRITAWVAANDAVAFMALSFLNERGVKVPRDISLVSFDDTHRAVAHQITSYNFNVPAIVAAAFRHILQHDQRASSRRAHVEEIDGTIVRRKTTDLRRR